MLMAKPASRLAHRQKSMACLCDDGNATLPERAANMPVNQRDHKERRHVFQYL